MWTRSLLRRAVATLPAWGAAGSRRPYEQLLRAMEQPGGAGLLGAAEVFARFEQFYRSEMRAQAGDKLAGRRDAVQSTVSRLFKPLTEFCGRSEDVEPVTLLLLKVLCDLQRMEEMRFLFTQCVLELDEPAPSTELFNVYLVAISLTDTFNRNEVENVVNIMHTKGVAPDVVTRLSILIFYLRLGQDCSPSWWRAIRDEVRGLMERNEVSRYPMLALRMQHLFQTMLRVHHDFAMLHECFELLHSLAPARLTRSLLMPYMMLSILNHADPPSHTIRILQLLEEQPGQSSSSTTVQGAADGTTSHENDINTALSQAVQASGVLTNEATVFRLLAKCAKWGDVAAARQVRRYIEEQRQQRHMSPIATANESLATLLYVETLVRGNAVHEAVQLVGRALAPPYCRPGERPKLFLQSQRLTLLHSDPITNLVAKIAEGGTERVTRFASQLLAPRTTTVAAASSDDTAHDTAVAATSLDLVMAAYAMTGGYVEAEQLLRSYETYMCAPTCFTYASLLRAYRLRNAARGVGRIAGVMTALEAAKVSPIEPVLLRAAMELAVAARDVAAALRVAAMHVTHGCSINTALGTSLLRLVTGALDADGLREVLRLMRASRSTVDARTVARCVAQLRRCNVTCDGIA